MRARPYPRYKPSGVEWLGDLPEHWDTVALKRGFRIVNGGTPSSSEDTYWEGEIPWFTPEDLGRIETKVISTSRRQITMDGLANCGASQSPSGSVLVSTRAPIGHVAVMGVDGCCNQGCRILVPQGAKVTADFGFYVVLASKSVLNSAGKGTTFLELSAGALGAHFIALPDPADQRLIAAFLDRETERVDRLVAKKRELIERLKEKRTALISHTVTRGLPPDAAAKAGLPANPPLKSSGVEWLGEIPKHWELLSWRRLILSLKDFGSNGSFAGLKENVEYLHEPDFAQLIRLTDLRGDLEHEGAIFVSEESFKYLKHSSLQGGEFLIANVGAHAGLVVEMPKIHRPATLGPNMMFAKRIREDKVTTRYLIVSAQSDLIRSQLTMIANASSAQPKLNKDDVRSIITPLPPLGEQAAIAAYLSEETAKLDALLAKAEEAIERLQEYRAALITAAVTGKIDVRGAEA